MDLRETENSKFLITKHHHIGGVLLCYTFCHMKTKKIIQKVLIGIIAAMFLFSAYGKLSGNIMAIMMLDTLNIGYLRVALGIIDIIIAVSLLWKKTRRAGIAIGTGYLGGAVLADLSLGGLGIIPGVLILVLWTIGYLQKGMYHTCHCGEQQDDQAPLCNCKPGCTCEQGKCTC